MIFPEQDVSRMQNTEDVEGIQLLPVSTPCGCMFQYIILNNGILKSNSSIFPRSEGYITQYTPYGLYRLIVNENNEVYISLMVVKMISCPY